MFSIVSSNLLPDHAAVFGVELDDQDCVIRFLRGVGLGEELRSIDGEVCRLAGTVSSYDDVMAAAAEHLRGRLGPLLAREPFAATLAQDLAEHPDRHGALGVYLVGDNDEEIVERLSDFAVASLASVAFADVDTLNVSAACREVAAMEICAASPVGIFVGPKGRCQVVSTRTIDTGNLAPDRDPLILEDGNDSPAWWVLPLYLGLEWSGMAPDIPEMAKLREIELPKEARPVEVASIDLVGDVVARISSWFWGPLSSSLADPFVRTDRDTLYRQALEAPMRFAAGDEAQLERLIGWVALMDEATDDMERSSATSEDEEERMGCFMSGFSAEAAQTIEVAASHLGRPAVIANYMPMAPRLRAVLQEILAWAFPRGSSVGLYATNRASSALHGPARRLYTFGRAAPSSHQAIEAACGLQAFLGSRGYDEAEIAALLFPEGPDPRRPLEDFGL